MYTYPWILLYILLGMHFYSLDLELLHFMNLGDVTCCYKEVNKDMDNVLEGSRVYMWCILYYLIMWVIGYFNIIIIYNTSLLI